MSEMWRSFPSQKRSPTVLFGIVPQRSLSRGSACDDLILALEHATCRIIAARFHLENERRRNMSRLTEKLALAAAVAPRQAAKIEARADAILAREPGIEQRTDDVFVPHERLMDEAEQGLDGLDAALRLMSNNPPLEHSTPLPAAAGATDRVALGPHPDQPEAGQEAIHTFRAAG